MHGFECNLEITCTSEFFNDAKIDVIVNDPYDLCFTVKLNCIKIAFQIDRKKFLKFAKWKKITVKFRVVTNTKMNEVEQDMRN